MRYCFNCGAPLMGSAASFCSECGKAMPVQKERHPAPPQNSQPKGKTPPSPPPKKAKGKGKPPAGYRPPPKDTSRPKGPPPPGITRKGPPPSSRTQPKNRSEPEVLKKVAKVLPPTEYVEPDIPDEFIEDESVFASESGEQTDLQDESLGMAADEEPDDIRDEDMPDPQDEGYDGYYNDVLPEDEGYVRERLEPELIKRIALVIGGVIVIVLLSVLIMNLL